VTTAGIVDLGICNLGSLESALSRLRVDTKVITSPKALDSVTHVILPGVGGFGEAAKRIKENGFYSPLRESIDSGKPFLGICLGMQLMAQDGLEGVPSQGLGITPGTVSPLEPVDGVRLPHVGWNSVSIQMAHPVFVDIPDGTDFYFVHGFAFRTVPDHNLIALTSHGVAFPSAVGQGSALGVQFHPEKSQEAGAQLLRNFLNWDGKC
jgi:imidazole glycerol-phosphate synthase subunit HisH